MKDFKKMPKMADGGSVDAEVSETKKYVKPGRPDLSGDSRGLLSRLKESKEKPQKPLGPVDMTGSMGNIGGKPETGNYRRPTSGGGSMGGGDMSGMKGLDKPYKRGGKVKK
jgi:hypothetical protein